MSFEDETGDSRQYRLGKQFVSAQIRAEIDWIREGYRKGMDLNPHSVLDYLEKVAINATVVHE